MQCDKHFEFSLLFICISNENNDTKTKTLSKMSREHSKLPLPPPPTVIHRKGRAVRLFSNKDWISKHIACFAWVTVLLPWARKTRVHWLMTMAVRVVVVVDDLHIFPNGFACEGGVSSLSSSRLVYTLFLGGNNSPALCVRVWLEWARARARTRTSR